MQPRLVILGLLVVLVASTWALKDVGKVVDTKKVDEVADTKKVKEAADDKKVKEVADDKKVKEVADDKKVKEVADDKKVKEVADDKKVKEVADDKKVKEVADDKKVKEVADDKKVKDTADADKADNSGKGLLDAGKVAKAADADKVGEVAKTDDVAGDKEGKKDDKKKDKNLGDGLTEIYAQADPTKRKLDPTLDKVQEAAPAGEQVHTGAKQLTDTETVGGVKDKLDKAGLEKLTDKVQETADPVAGYEDKGILKDHILAKPTSTERPEVCDERCPRNSSFVVGSICGDGCIRHLFPPRNKDVCEVSRRNVSGCFCDPGFCRHPVTRECIFCTECPISFYKEVYFWCNNRTETFEVCGNPCRESFKYISGQTECLRDRCVNTCYCKEGYFRTDDGICVSKKRLNSFNVLGDNFVYDKYSRDGLDYVHYKRPGFRFSLKREEVEDSPRIETRGGHVETVEGFEDEEDGEEDLEEERRQRISVSRSRSGGFFQIEGAKPETDEISGVGEEDQRGSSDARVENAKPCTFV